MTKKTWISAGIFLFAFAYYLHGAAPTVTTGDAGEFITAARTLAIPHPPAFPSYTLTARVFTDFFAWGNPGYRMNVFSSACTALSIAIFALLLLEAGIALPVVGFSILLIFQAPHMTTVASVTEVFAFHLVLSLGILLTASTHPLFSVFLLGIGFANHQTILLLAPVLLLFNSELLLAEKWRILLWTGVFALGASVYLFLPLRAVHHPLMNWGDPETLNRFYRMITRADYGSLTLALGESPARTIANTGLQLKRFIEGMASQVTWVGILAGVIGLCWACARERKTWAWALAFVLVGPFFFVLGNLPFDAQSTGLLGRFYTLPLFLWVLFIAFGCTAMSQFSPVVPWLVIGLPLLFIVQRRPAEATPWRHEFGAYAYGRNNLKSLPLGSNLIMDGGDDTFYTLAYLTQVEHRRSDLELHDRGGLVFSNPYGADFRQLTHDEKEVRRQEIERLMLASRRPLYFSTMNPKIMPGTTLQLAGILYAAQPPAISDLWPFYDLRGVSPWQPAESPVDYRTRALLPFYAYQRAALAAQNMQWPDAYALLSLAKAIGPDVLWLKPNAVYQAYVWAGAAFGVRDFKTARAFYQAILAWEPGETTALSNLHVVEQRLR